MTTSLAQSLGDQVEDRAAISPCCGSERHDGYELISALHRTRLFQISPNDAYKVEKAKQTVTPEKNMPSIRTSPKVAVAY